MYKSIITFDVRSGMEAEFEAAFHAAGMLTRPTAIPGFQGAELVRAIDDPARYAVLGQWETRESYAQWQAVAQSGAPRDALQKLAACLLNPQPGRLYKAVTRPAL